MEIVYSVGSVCTEKSSDERNLTLVVITFIKLVPELL